MWKTAAGRVLYQSPEGITVSQNPVYRWLTFKNSKTLQTLIRRKHPEKPALQYMHPMLLPIRQDPGPVCLLGLGGAGIPHALSHNPFPLTAVEKSQSMIHIARNFFQTDRLKNLQIIHDAAESFLSSQNETFKHLLIDLSTDQVFPEACHSRIFFENCMNALQPESFLAINLPHPSQHKSVLNHLRTLFPHKTLCIPVQKTTNIIILATNHTTIGPLLERMKPGKRKFYWDPEWGYVG